MRRKILILLVLLVLLILASLAGVAVGAVRLSLPEIAEGLFTDGNATSSLILRTIRLPRVITGILAGAALASAGAVLQGIMRNPLAEPGLMGITPGAGLAAVLILILFPGHTVFLIPGAFLGALAAALTVYLLAWDHGVRPLRLILAGVALAGMLGSFITLLFLFHPDRIAGAMEFTVGSLSLRSWEQSGAILPCMAAGMAGVLLLSRRLNILAMGDDVAAGLGVAVERDRFLLLACASLLAAAAVSMAGLLGFVGLIAPHIVRMLLGSDHRYLIPGSALFGAFLVILCDTAARTLFAPAELPAGVLLSLLGPPFFLYLLNRRTGHAS